MAPEDQLDEEAKNEAERIKKKTEKLVTEKM